MKNLLINLMFLLILTGRILGQAVAINTDGSVAHASAILDVKSTTKGILIPRMTTAQRNAIAAPATGLLIFNTDNNTFQFLASAGVWTNLNSEKILSDADGDTKIQVEEGVNDNAIRFDISGDERMKLVENSQGVPRLELLNSLSNIFIGERSGELTTTGQNNIGIGTLSLRSNTTGLWNHGVGYASLTNITTGFSNNAFGLNSLFSLTTGQGNSAFGTKALHSCNGGENSAFGQYSLYSTTTGLLNTGIGAQSLYNQTIANYNSALGYAAGFEFDHGSGNTFIGANTAANAGGYINSTALGFETAITASNQVRVGSNLVTSIGGFQGWTTLPSDARFKYNVKENVPGLAFINKIRAVTYQIDIEGIKRHANLPGTENISSKAASQVRTGFIAQEVERAAAELNFEFDGVDKPENEKDLYGLRYAEFTVPLVKAVQELDAENKQLRAEMKQLLTRLERLEAQTKH